MISSLNEPRERCRVCCYDGIGTGEAAEIMSAELAGARAGCDAGERVLAIKAEHRHRLAARSCVHKRFGVVLRATSLNMPLELALQGGDANLVLTLHLRPLHVAHSRRQVCMVRDLLGLSQIPRQSIKRREHARTDRGESKGRQVMPGDKEPSCGLDE